MKRSFVIHIILLLCVCVLTACSPQKRVARIVKKNNLQTATEYVKDTVIVPERVRTDTVIMKDSIVKINDTSFITELIRLNDTAYIVTTTLKADTIIKEIPYQRYNVIDKERKIGFVECISIFLLWVVVVLGIILLIRFIKK